MHARTALTLAFLLVAPLSGCIVPENMTALREDLGYNSVELPELTAKARASTLSPRVHENVTFTADVSGIPLANATITWTIDATERQGRTVHHTFTQPGPISVSLAVTGDGATAKDALNLTIEENTPPQAAITAPDPSNVRAGEPVTLTAAGSTDADGDTLSYAWAIDGEPAGTGAEVTTRLDPGVREIKLTASDGLNTTAAFQMLPVAEPLHWNANLSATEDVQTQTIEIRPGVAAFTLTLTHTTHAGVDDVQLVVLDDQGEEVDAARTQPDPGSSTADERLEVGADELAPGAYTIEAQLDRGVSAEVALQGLVTYQAPSS